MVQALRNKASDRSIKRPFSRTSVTCPVCRSPQTMWFSVFKKKTNGGAFTSAVDDYRCLSCGEFFEIHTMMEGE